MSRTVKPSFIVVALAAFLSAACVRTLEAQESPSQATPPPIPASAAPAPVATAPERTTIEVDSWAAPKRGWLYVLDSQPQLNEHGGAIWLVDPQAGQVMGGVRTGQDPDFALSPDGSRLYISAYSDGNRSDLASIDTATGIIVAQTTVENRTVARGTPAFPGMAVSGDGVSLRMQINSLGAAEADGFGLAAFNAQSLSTLPGPTDVGDCGLGRFISFPSAGDFIFLCPMTNRIKRVHFARLSQGPDLASVQLPWERRFGVAATFVAPGGRQIAIARGDGAILVMDIDTGLIASTAVQGGLKLQGRILPAAWPSTADGSKVYLGYARNPVNSFYLNYGRDSSTRNDSATADEFHVFDTQTWHALGTVRTRMPFWSAALSRDGASLYALVPNQHAILVIDTASLKETGEIDVGGMPALALVAP